MDFRQFFAQLLHNWPIKFFSFLAALLLYFGYQILSLQTSSFSVPLIIKDETTLSMNDDPPKMISVSVRAKPEDIAKIRENDISAYINTSPVSASGQYDLPIRFSIANNLLGMDPLEITSRPSHLRLNFEEITFAWVPIKVLFVGEVSKGYYVDSWTTEPEYIKLKGPSSIMQSSRVVHADKIQLEGKKTSFQEKTTFSVLHPKLIAEYKGKITVNVVIKPNIINRQFDNIYIIPLHLNAQLDIENQLDSISLTLSGEELPLTQLQDKNILVEADFSFITEAGSYNVPLRVTVPDIFAVKNITKTNIEATVVEKVRSNDNLEKGELNE